MGLPSGAATKLLGQLKPAQSAKGSVGASLQQARPRPQHVPVAETAAGGPLPPEGLPWALPAALPGVRPPYTKLVQGGRHEPLLEPP